MLCTYLSPLHILGGQRVVQRDVVGDLLHEPLEALAAMLLPDSGIMSVSTQQQRQSQYNNNILVLICKSLPEAFELANVPIGQSESFGTTGIEVVLVLVPPHFHHTDVVLETDTQTCFYCYPYYQDRDNDFSRWQIGQDQGSTILHQL